MSDAKDDVERINAILTEMLLQRMPEPGHYPTPISGFVLHRRDIPNRPENCFNRPILAVTVQGAKRTVLGNEEYRYGAGHSLLAGVDMPSMSYLTDASRDKPYLVLSLDLDSQIITELALQLSDHKASSSSNLPPDRSFKGTAVTPTDPEVLRAFLRLMELLDQPEQIAILAPSIIREIHFCLLLGPAGNLLRIINTHGSQSHQVLRSINWLRENFTKPLEVEALAHQVHMAPPTFRKHFKAVTSMSPTQYHKQLRLYEAQRLMLENREDATSAGYAVGYESLTQFNREYKRLFGAPPMRNVNQLR